MTFTFTAANIYRGSELIRPDFSWTWEEGDHWLLTGPVGSGKTTIAEAITGNCRTSAGALTFFEQGRPVSIYAAKAHIRHLTFAEDTHKRRFGDVFYYQQRYQAMESEAGLTVAEYLFGKKEAVPPEALGSLQLEPLLQRRFIQLSNGQTRRVRLAKCLMADPKLLILEDVFTGIDRQTTGIIEAMLRLQAAAGTHILLTGSYAPEFITHVLELKDAGKYRLWSRPDWLNKKDDSKASENRQHAIPDALLREPAGSSDWNFQNALFFKHVSVRYKDNVVIHDLDWQVKKGEKWMLSGPNGSGKSSLISLVFADNPQAYSQRISLFDRPRGSGESIWDIKRKIGFISPELQTYMRNRRNAVDVAAAGYTNTAHLSRKLTPAEVDRLRRLFDYFSIRRLAKKPYMDLSTGEQRLVLFIRAVLNNAPLLILDEPFHAMDEHYRNQCIEFLTAYCHPGRSLIYVSHLQEPPPSFITHELKL